MAQYGLSHPFFAKLGATKGVYTAGFQCGKAISTDITPNFNEASLFADNALSEYVKEFKDADVNLGVDEMPLSAADVIFGHAISTEDNSVTYGSEDSANYVGFGIYVNVMKDGAKTVMAAWLPKCKFTDSAETYTTKGDSITFATPTLSGKALPDEDGNWRYKQGFDTEAEAITWLKTKACITDAAPQA
ncbi:MAG: major tail protein [Lachnospiraceae bacterium]|nr:major tail protein [Lachnospiraceae bacterium]